MIIRPVPVAALRDLFQQHHGYKSVGDVATYAFGVYERASHPFIPMLLVAGYTWNPPPYGAAASVCAVAPYAVLALSRMVALPKSERKLKHISKPLMHQMKHLIDRTRWPVLITYSDEGQGHTGYVYQCSGWTKTQRRTVKVFETAEGARASAYTNGVYGRRAGLVQRGTTFIQRWENWAVTQDDVINYMTSGGWVRKQTDRVWKSGNRAYTVTKCLQ